jgi:hypothetical protein
MLRIFGVYPYGKDNFHTGWHLVICNKWIKILNLPGWCQTAFTYDDSQCFHFVRYWGPGRNIQDDPLPEENCKLPKYAHFMFDAPWCRYLYKKEYLKRGVWTKYSDLTWETQEREEVLQDKYFTKFKFEDEGKEIEVHVTVIGERLHYALYFLPDCLKHLWSQVQTYCWISFSTDIGKNRGTWKGGVTGLRYPLNKNLPTTWLDFEYNELPEYLKGNK